MKVKKGYQSDRLTMLDYQVGERAYLYLKGESKWILTSTIVSKTYNGANVTLKTQSGSLYEVELI